MTKLFGLVSFFAAVLVFFGLVFLFFSNGPLAHAVFIASGIISLFMVTFYFILDITKPVPEVPKLKKHSSLSIIIPCYNAEKTLEDCLRHVLALEYPRKEVLVVDDGSTDSSLKIAKKFSRVKIIAFKKNMGKAHALNAGIAKAKGEIVACIDSDTYPPVDALKKAVPYFYRRPNVGAVTLYIVVAKPRGWIKKIQELEYYSGFGFVPKATSKINGLMVAPGPMSLFRRDALLKVGCFDEHNLTEDMEIGLRLQDNGYYIEYCDEVSVPTEVPESMQQLYRQRIRWYRGTIFNLVKYRHMLFNNRFSDFGVFSFPVVSMYVLIVLLSFTVILGRVLYSVYSTASIALALFLSGAFPVLRFDLESFTVSSMIFFVLLTIGVWSFYFLKSMSLINRKWEKRMFSTMVLIFLLYPLMISFFYVSSLFHELLESDRAW